jgi:protein-disulfide isomerase
MKRLLAPVLAAALPAMAQGAAPQNFDETAFLTNFRKAFSVPLSINLSMGALKPSAIPGFQSGEISAGEGASAQKIPVQISNDRRFYIMSPTFKFVPSAIPGFQDAAPVDSGQDAPPVHITYDGKFFLMGQFKDLTTDPDEANSSKIKLQGVPFIGPSTAPVTLVEYSDFQCPHCKKAFETIDRDILPAYPGKIRLVFKHYPLKTLHEWAYDAALAAACAGMQSASAEHALAAAFFEEQKTLKKEDLPKKAVEAAKKAGLDIPRFEACVDKGKSKAVIDADSTEAESLGVTGTPALFVNGRRSPHYQPEVLKPIIDEMLGADGAK